jgi:murein DD-endopeptidase MepM/ murein hydrolase activator NlpD
MTWHNPIPLKLVESDQSESFREMKAGCTALPLPPHPGAFGVRRLHHFHEGIDLYCPVGTPVMAVEDGMVVLRQNFTGPKAHSPWWHDTEALLIEGKSGVVVYGEIAPHAHLTVGQNVRAGQEVGTVLQVLKEDKGRPMSMLHLELHTPGTRDTFEWPVAGPRPASLLDPTGLLSLATP